MQDFTNKTFGKLLVIAGIEPNNSKNKPNIYKKYKCLCDCGKTINILTSQLIRGTKSCGCLRIYNNLTNKLYPGLKINRFTVIKFCDKNLKWELLCQCGNIYYSDAKRILRNNTKSCGCLNKEKRKEKAICLINNKSDPDPLKILAKKIFRDRYSDGDLTLEIFLEKSQLPCFYCGAEKTNKMIKKPSEYSYLYKLSEESLTFKYNGLDRIDSLLTHNIDNCVTSCYFCNHSKSNMDQNDFIKYLQKLASHKINYSFDDYRKLANSDISFFQDKNKFSLIKSIKSIYKSRYNDGDLLITDFYKLSQINCYYCGAEPFNLTNRAKQIKKSSQLAKNTGDFVYNGLDRINSKEKHNYNNLITCCKYCNFTKSSNTLEEFQTWIARVKKFNEDK